MASLKMFTEKDIAILQAMIEAQKKGIKGHGSTVPSLGGFEDDQNTPEVYIALPPEGGIPALIRLADTLGEGDIPGEAECEIYRLIHNQPEDPYLESIGIGTKTVYNLSESDISGGSAWVLIHRTKQGRWIVPTGGGASVLHCRVTECLGSGYYKGTIGTRPSFVIPSPTSTGTAAVPDATGTGTSDSSDCDICTLIVGENTGTDDTEASCGTLQEPPRVSPPGSVQEVYIYDPRAIPLKIGGHALIMDCGDTAHDPSSDGATTGTGTGTGTTVSSVKLYMVLTGTYEVVGIPDRFYTCCTGPPQQVILSRCDTYIVEGAYCPGVEVACPITTGTAG